MTLCGATCGVPSVCLEVGSKKTSGSSEIGCERKHEDRDKKSRGDPRV